ncbi:hypothetical protein ABZY10_34740 [Streptomyces sp. NPDC006539]
MKENETDETASVDESEIVTEESLDDVAGGGGGTGAPTGGPVTP